MLRWLLELIRGTGRRTGRVLPKRERVRMIFTRLQDAAPARDAEEALALIRQLVDEVEDRHSGFPREEHPPFDSERMYGPLDDRVTRHGDGRMTAETARQWIYIGSDGGIRIESKTGRLLLEKPGSGRMGNDD